MHLQPMRSLFDSLINCCLQAEAQVITNYLYHHGGEGLTAYLVAARAGRTAMLEHLEHRYNGNTHRRDDLGLNRGWSALLEAAWHLHLDTVKYLLVTDITLIMEADQWNFMPLSRLIKVKQALYPDGSLEAVKTELQKAEAQMPSTTSDDESTYWPPPNQDKSE